jgi:hypothetical protein
MQQTFELKLADGRVVEWQGTDGVDASRRYVDAHRDAAVVAWRYPRIYVGPVHHSQIIG